MYRSHKIRIYPSDKQTTFLIRSVGVSRFVYNWGLAEWKSQYEQGKKPTRYGLKLHFNKVKRLQFPFVCEVSKHVAEYAFINLEKAFKNFFRRVKNKAAKAGYPKFKKKGLKDSFTIEGASVKVGEKSLKLPKLKALKMAEPLRFAGKIVEVTVSKKAGKWFASILVKLPDSRCKNQERPAVGVDLGISKLATLSDGTVFENPRTLRRFEKQLRLQNKALSRKKKGSKNREKAKRKLQVTYYKIACARQDALHKLTTLLSRKYGTICIEDLNVQGMKRNRKLAKAVADAGFGMFRQMLEYKAACVQVVDHWFPSTKLCPACGQINSMPLSKRIYVCDCGYGPIDRDLHAAKNILRQGLPKN